MSNSNKRILLCISVLIALIAICPASSCQVANPQGCKNEPVKKGSCKDDPNSQTAEKPTDRPVEAPSAELTVDKIIEKLRLSNKELNFYNAKIEYLFLQDPDLINSQTLRKGSIYYRKRQKGSDLLIDFNSIKQDDAPAEKHLEIYLFDGVYLRIFDYQNKTINTYQKAEKDDPKDAFDLIGTEFPMIGFTQTDSLRRQFHISLIDAPKTVPKDVIALLLRVKKGSIYEEQYKTIRFWIDKRTFLPARLVATSTEGDIYDIRLLDIFVNKKLPKGIFKVETGDDFSENMHPLKR